MSKDTIVLREIDYDDDIKIAKAIRGVLHEFGVPKVGTAYEDIALDRMTETYDGAGKVYFVVVQGDNILGGAGISALNNCIGNVCELQKMYFLPEVRGRGLGRAMMAKCLAFAKDAGYTQCYLETMPYMYRAQKLYEDSGFRYIDEAMGDTGHYSCKVWMLKDL